MSSGHPFRVHEPNDVDRRVLGNNRRLGPGSVSRARTGLHSSSAAKSMKDDPWSGSALQSASVSMHSLRPLRSFVGKRHGQGSWGAWSVGRPLVIARIIGCGSVWLKSQSPSLSFFHSFILCVSLSYCCSMFSRRLHIPRVKGEQVSRRLG